MFSHCGKWHNKERCREIQRWQKKEKPLPHQCAIYNTEYDRYPGAKSTETDIILGLISSPTMGVRWAQECHLCGQKSIIVHICAATDVGEVVGAGTKTVCLDKWSYGEMTKKRDD